MGRFRKPNNPIRKRMIEAVQSEFQRSEKEMAEMLSGFPADLAKINVAQNVIRDCLAAILEEMIPYPPETAVELSRRAASYALSVLPIEDLEVGVADHLDGFADFHLERTLRGMIIGAGWTRRDGTFVSYFPDGSGE